MVKLTGSLVTFPARLSLTGYLLLILLGASLLSLPFSRSGSAEPLGTTDSVFTATSAVCVTGLVVRSTGNDFSLFGQCVILALIQLGGIGIMTVTTYVILQWQSQHSLHHRQLAAETIGPTVKGDLGSILFRVIGVTALFEGIGFIILAARFALLHDYRTALWSALFHAISAYCNAGFSLNDDSLTQYQFDPVVNITIMLLIMVGGIGYPVLFDLHRCWKRKRQGFGFWEHLRLHSKLMLLGTATLIAAGAGVVLLLEWDGVLQPFPWVTRPLVALFHSVSCRTAGFNTIDIGSLTNATLFFSLLLMAIGAGPCSTGGGFKVSTIAVLVLRAWSTFSGHHHVRVFRRTIPREVVNRAIATAMLFFVVSVVALTTLLLVEQSSESHVASQKRFLDAMFEIISALGTVGLSTGVTASLSHSGRWIVIVLMLMGRIGPLSVFVALSRAEHDDPIEYPAEEPLIG